MYPDITNSDVPSMLANRWQWLPSPWSRMGQRIGNPLSLCSSPPSADCSAVEEKEAGDAGTHPEAAHVGVHRGHRSSPRHREKAPEVQERLRHEEGGGARPSRVHPLRRRRRRPLTGADLLGRVAEPVARVPTGSWDPLPNRGRVRGLHPPGDRAGDRRARAGEGQARPRPGGPRRVQQRGLSAATCAQVRSVLCSALRQAVADGLITVNPVSAVKRPRVQRRELRWPTFAQLGALLRACRGTLLEIQILLATVTGARRAEVLGISWEDVDLKTGTVFIRRGVQPVRGGDGMTAEFTPLKTKRSRRVVQLPPFALDRIRRHRREQLKRRSELGSRWRDPLDELGRPVALVCDRGDGFFVYPDSFTSAFSDWLARPACTPTPCGVKTLRPGRSSAFRPAVTLPGCSGPSGTGLCAGYSACSSAAASTSWISRRPCSATSSSSSVAAAGQPCSPRPIGPSWRRREIGRASCRERV